jgi:hypothetical protein
MVRRFVDAIKYFEQALATARANNDLSAESTPLLNLGWAYQNPECRVAPLNVVRFDVVALGGQRTSEDVTRVTDLVPVIRVYLVFSASPKSGPQPHRL